MARRGQIDVAPDHLRIVMDILRRHVPHLGVWAFGSRATGKAKPYSGLDLAIISGEPLPMATLAALADAFSESDLSWRVDLVDWSTTSPSFREIIETDRWVLQAASDGSGRAETEAL